MPFSKASLTMNLVYFQKVKLSTLFNEWHLEILLLYYLKRKWSLRQHEEVKGQGTLNMYCNIIPKPWGTKPNKKALH